MNQSHCFGSPAVNPACPNRNQNFLFRHSEPPRVNLRQQPNRAAEELRKSVLVILRTNLGTDAFHPRPTSFRRAQLCPTQTSICAQAVFSLSKLNPQPFWLPLLFPRLNHNLSAISRQSGRTVWVLFPIPPLIKIGALVRWIVTLIIFKAVSEVYPITSSLKNTRKTQKCRKKTQSKMHASPLKGNSINDLHTFTPKTQKHIPPTPCLCFLLRPVVLPYFLCRSHFRGLKPELSNLVTSSFPNL